LGCCRYRIDCGVCWFFSFTVEGVVLWQMGIFSASDVSTGGVSTSYGGKGLSDFAQMKVLDHTFSDGSLILVFINGAGVRADNLSVSVEDVDFSEGLDSRSVRAGDTFRLVAVPDVCGSGVGGYDVTVDISYVNSVVGLERVDSGRVWGPCE